MVLIGMFRLPLLQLLLFLLLLLLSFFFFFFFFGGGGGCFFVVEGGVRGGGAHLTSFCPDPVQSYDDNMCPGQPVGWNLPAVWYG